MMRRMFCMAVFLLSIMIVSAARRPIKEWLVSMPDSVLPLLTKNNRLDFIDFWDCGMDAVVTNRLEGKSRLDTLTDSFLSLGYTASTDVMMRLLPIGDTLQVLCMVTTVKSAVEDSRVAFYNEKWYPLSAWEFITEPDIDDFRGELEGDSAVMSWQKMDVLFKTYHLVPDALTLICRLNIGYLSKDDWEALQPYIKSREIYYHWANGMFDRVDNLSAAGGL